MPVSRSDIFSRVIVDHLLPIGSRISWQLNPHFFPGTIPEFQLQVSSVGTATADDWADVGLPTYDVYATDDERRRVGKDAAVFYRVKILYDDEEAYSPVAMAFGLLSQREWLLARATIRRRRLRNDKRDAADGWLLKRRNSGEQNLTAGPAEQSVSRLTGRVVNSRQILTHGTEYLGGYYPPRAMPMIFSPSQDSTKRDKDRGMISDGPFDCECVPYPPPEPRDIWISKHDDHRYYIDTVNYTAELRQVPLVAVCRMNLAPIKDAIYQIEL